MQVLASEVVSERFQNQEYCMVVFNDLTMYLFKLRRMSFLSNDISEKNVSFLNKIRRSSYTKRILLASETQTPFFHLRGRTF